MWKSFALSLLVIASLVAMTGEPCGPAPHWSYDTGATNGPFYWGSLKTDWEVCSDGTSQSPIDLRDAGSLAPELTVTYGNMRPDGGRIRFENNGHTVEVHNGNGSNRVRITGVGDFHLARFHVHTPSEHTVAGAHYPLEIHMVNSGSAGDVALGVMVVATSRDNPQIQTVLDATPRTCTTEERNVQINVNGLLPANQRNYFYYDGSLTTPGCNQPVRWFVFKTPIKASATQIIELRNLFGMNARPIQDPRGRRIMTR